MNKPSFWQRMTAYPARRGLGIAIAIIILGCSIVLLQVVPADLRAQGAAWLGVFWAQLGALDPHVLFSVAGGVLILGGIVLGLLPALRRTYRARPPRVAPISIYLDYENQPLTVAKIPAFVAFLKQQIGNQRVECFFYTDEKVSPNQAYPLLSRYGFRMIQVAHKGKKLGGTNVKNMVDMELALHAFERAMLTRERQHIVIIAADRDYMPLLYRLRALGHDVSVWAREVPRAIRDLHEEIGIDYIAFGAQFDENAPKKKPATVAIPAGSKQVAPPAATTQPVAPPALSPLPSAANADELFTTMIERTLDYLQAAGQKPAEKQYLRFLSLLTDKGNLKQIGFTAHHRAQHWATVLTTVGVLTQTKAGKMYGRGKESAESGAATLQSFIAELVTLITATADSAGGTVDLKTVRQQMAHRGKQTADELSKLYALTGDQIHYIMYFVACAQIVGLVAYQEIDQFHIHVRIVTMPENMVEDHDATSTLGNDIVAEQENAQNA